MPSTDAPVEGAPPATPAKATSPPGAGKENAKVNGTSKPSTAPEGEKKLTGAELKAQKKAEKAAKRAAVISQRGGDAGAPGQGPPQAGGQAQIPFQKGSTESSKNKASQGHKRSGSNVKDLKTSPDSSKKGSPESKKVEPKKEDKTVELFRHLYRKRADTVAGWKDVHPAVQHLGQQMRTYVICGSTARLVAMMQCFQRVIEDYTTPGAATFARHFIAHELSPQIEYLIACRPMSVSMGNAIRWLKLQIAKIDPDMQDADAKAMLCTGIDDFLRERVIAAGQSISELCYYQILKPAGLAHEHQTILTFGKSNVVAQALAQAKNLGVDFSVIVVDSRPLFEGKAMTQSLMDLGIDVKYTLMNGLGHCMKSATKVFLGAHAMMSNGVLYSRVGSAQVAMEAKDCDVPVIVLCEVVKCTDKVALDSIVFNEVADPDELEFAGWRDVKGLQVLNIMHDATPAEYISSVVTETGIVPPSSVAVLQRWAHDRDEKKDEKEDADE